MSNIKPFVTFISSNEIKPLVDFGSTNLIIGAILSDVKIGSELPIVFSRCTFNKCEFVPSVNMRAFHCLFENCTGELPVIVIDGLPTDPLLEPHITLAAFSNPNSKPLIVEGFSHDPH